MALRKAHPIVWSPRGVSDTLDSSTAFSGAMASLSNLIPDPSTKDLWECRPAALQLTAFAGFNTPGFISVDLVVGNFQFGMVATARNPGNDEPFCYNLLTSTFVTISGVTSGNTPASPPSSGQWNPPVMALVGTKIIVAHPGFTGAGGAFFGVLDITNPAAPAWSAANTSINALLAPPQWVANFNGRCYFLVNPPNAQPASYFSDVLIPTQITNANQIITYDDNVALTVAAGLPLENQLGGIVQSLMVFKGLANIYQITGDFALSNLSKNSLNVATGTLGANTVTPTTEGLAFIAPDGLRVITFDARVTPPIGKAGDGVTAPFFFALTPSRMNAAFNGGVYRVQVQNGLATGSPQQEWWYDFVRQVWSGPHTTNVSMISPWNNTFLITIIGQGAKIFQSDQVQSATSTYVEIGAQLTYAWQTALLPDTDQMVEACIIEATLFAALVPAFNIVVNALDQNNTVLDTVTIAATGAVTLWGSFTWGQALWQGAANALAPRALNWHQPLVFRRLTIAAAGLSAQGVKIGRLHMRYQLLGYLQTDLGTISGSAVPPSSTPYGIHLVGILGIGTFTLSPNVTTTTVVAPCTPSSVVLISPETQDAANDMATTSIVPGTGQFVVTHANNSRNDRTFAYQVVG